MKNIFAKLTLVATALVLSTTMAVAGISLDAAKSNGWVAEQANGLLSTLAGAPAEVSALVKTTNDERLAKYKSIAEKNGIPLQQVQAVAGKKLLGQ